MLDWLNPYRWILGIALVAAVVLGVPVLVKRYDAHQQEIGYQRRAAEDKAAADAQTTTNRELSRLAEQHLHVLTAAQSKFITHTAQEAHDAAAPLAACPVPDAVVLRLNAAARCARGDSPGACGAGDAVRDPR